MLDIRRSRRFDDGRQEKQDLPIAACGCGDRKLDPGCDAWGVVTQNPDPRWQKIY